MSVPQNILCNICQACGKWYDAENGKCPYCRIKELEETLKESHANLKSSYSKRENLEGKVTILQDLFEDLFQRIVDRL